METAYSYTNNQAIADGIFAEVTPASMEKKGFRWIVTSAVYEQFSLAAFAELFNVMAGYYNTTQDTMTTGKMNGETLMLMLEAENGKKIFKICYPYEL